MKRDVQLMVELSRLMVGVAYEALEGKLELLQFRALAFIAQRGQCRVGELAQDSALPSASTKRLCDRLVEQGWIRRTTPEDDRRQVVLQLTPSGAAVVDSVLDARAERLGQAFRRLTPAQRRALSDVLPALLTAMHAQEAGPVWAV
jgi:DNA-binding MarR family transcriptional regulator